MASNTPTARPGPTRASALLRPGPTLSRAMAIAAQLPQTATSQAALAQAQALQFNNWDPPSLPVPPPPPPPAPAYGPLQDLMPMADGSAPPQDLMPMAAPTAAAAPAAPAALTAALTAAPAPTAPPPDTSFAGALRHGLHDAAMGFGATATDLGAVGLGRTIQGAIADTPGYQPALGGLDRALGGGHLLSAAEYLPRLAVEAAPDIIGAAGAGAAGTALAGPAGGVAGVMGFTGARTLGNNANTLAGGAAPTWGDMAGAAGLSATEGALAAVGLRGAAALPGAAGAALDAAGPGIAASGRAAGADLAAIPGWKKATAAWLLYHQMTSTPQQKAAQRAAAWKLLAEVTP